MDNKQLNYAPIIIFTYRRLDHLQKAISALKQNPEAQYSQLFVYSDAGKDEETRRQVSLVREFLRSLAGFAQIRIVEREENWGIEKSEIVGITEVLDKYNKAIILEDDIVVGPQFLSYMNSALERYEEIMQVYSITGYSFLQNSRKNSLLPEYAFLRLSSAWGWGTWKNRWDKLKTTITAEDINELRVRWNEFDYGAGWADMLMSQFKAGYVTWDILWYWTTFVYNGLMLMPIQTMVNNIGMDGSGVHYTEGSVQNCCRPLKHKYNMSFPEDIIENRQIRELLQQNFQRQHASGLWSRILKRIFRIIKRNV